MHDEFLSERRNKMKSAMFLQCIILFALPLSGNADTGSIPVDSLGYQYDTYSLQGKELRITFIGHASLLFSYDNKTIYVDPVSMFADFSKFPKADLVLVTHSHQDHLDKSAIAKITKTGTIVIANPESAKQVPGAIALSNGEQKSVSGFVVDAVAAYNTTSGREGFHPKGRDNGYVLGIGGKRIYIAGDTEDIPEMAALKDIYIAFLPMNQPYTMVPKQVAGAAKTIKPQILYPYHMSETKPEELVSLLANEKSIEVRVRKLK
jgi:L-ascorbate metabolism protein UlaG (beta-lactamase superfamily)